MKVIECPISLGELIDKISILEIKTQRIDDVILLTFLETELEMLKHKLTTLKLKGLSPFLEKLMDMNARLWDIENALREKEDQKSFDSEFLSLARQVYQTNDKRFSIKNDINQKYRSYLHEIKSYKA